MTTQLGNAAEPFERKGHVSLCAGSRLDRPRSRNPGRRRFKSHPPSSYSTKGLLVGTTLLFHPALSAPARLAYHTLVCVNNTTSGCSVRFMLDDETFCVVDDGLIPTVGS